MRKQSIEEKVIEGIDHLWGESVTTEASLLDDLWMDELDGVELVMLMEKEFKMEIPDEAWVKWRTVQDIIDYVKEHGTEEEY